MEDDQYQENNAAPVMGKTDLVKGKDQPREGDEADEFREFDKTGDDAYDCSDKEGEINAVLCKRSRVHR